MQQPNAQISVLTLSGRLKRRGVRGLWGVLQRRAERWLPENLARDPIASRLLHLRLQRLRDRCGTAGVTIGRSAAALGASVGQAPLRDVQALWDTGALQQTLADRPLLLLGDLAASPNDQQAFVNVLNACGALGQHEVYAGFSENIGLPNKASHAIVPAGLLQTTTVVLFGFYGRNYGIRDQVFYEMVLFDRARPLAVTQGLLGPQQSRWLPLARCFPAVAPQEYGDLRIEVKAYHPEMARVRSPENRFFLIMASPEGRGCAVSHSLPGFRRASVRAYGRTITAPEQRGYVPQRRDAAYAYLIPIISAERGARGLLSNSGASRIDAAPANSGGNGHVVFERLPRTPAHYGLFGFSFIRSAAGQGLSYWHDGHNIPPRGSLQHWEENAAGDLYAENLPIVFSQRGALQMALLLDSGCWSSRFTALGLQVMSPDGERLAAQDVTLDGALQTLDIFSTLGLDAQTLVEGSYLSLYPLQRPEGPLNPRQLLVQTHVCYYNTSGLQDVTHSLSSFSYVFRAFGRQAGLQVSKSPPLRIVTRTNKWGPFGRTGGVEPCVHVIHNGAGDYQAPQRITARLWLDDGSERLVTRTLRGRQAACLKPADFGFSTEERFQGVMCLESDYANLVGYWVLKTTEGEGAGIDHLSGG